MEETVNKEAEKKFAIAEAMTVSISPKEYAQRREEFSDPYQEIIKVGETEVVCFGANHQNNPEDPQIEQIIDLIQIHRPELVLVEGMRILEDKERVDDFREHVHRMSYEEAATYGEAFVTTWAAVANDISVASPEPPYKQLFEELEASGFDKRAILLEKLLCVGAQWKSHDVDQTIDEYAKRLREEWATLLDLPQNGDVFEQCEQYAYDLDMPLNRSNMFEQDLIFHLQDPIPWEGKTMYPTNYAAQASSAIRDRFILERIYDEIKRGTKNQMIVYGASHIHMQAPAIRKLVEIAG